jgi:predicted nucleotidyltransferase component of viral defense system
MAGLDVPVDTVPEIIAKKIRYRLRELRPRDIFDVAVAADREPGLFMQLLNKRATTLDELYEWRMMLSRLDKVHYHDSIQVLQPEPQFRSFAMDAPALLIDAIERTKGDLIGRS